MLLLPVLLALAPGPAPDRPPGFVVFLVDDLGWRDAGFQGDAWLETPHADRLAAEGLVFTDAYANGPNCAPSRASLMTGLYPPRHRVITVGSSARGRAADRALVPVPNEPDLGERFETVAEVLAEAGYRTAAVGKWHLGPDPREQGFDVNVGGNRSGHPVSHFAPYRNPDLADGPDGESLTDRLTDEALAFLDGVGDAPFLLYLSHYAVHTPIQAAEEEVAHFRAKPTDREPANARYAAMVARVDASLGRVLAKLDELGRAEDTLVLFTSDNGGHGRVTTMAPLRGAKGMLYEGGIRVPFVARWPGRIAPGRTAAPVIGSDVFPTLVELAGLEPRDVDGTSLVPLLDGREIPERALFWHFPAYLEAGGAADGPWRTTPAGAVRDGRWKLIEHFEGPRLELYDLEADPGETADLAAREPAEAARLHRALARWRSRAGARMPEPVGSSRLRFRPPPVLRKEVDLSIELALESVSTVWWSGDEAPEEAVEAPVGPGVPVHGSGCDVRARWAFEDTREPDGEELRRDYRTVELEVSWADGVAAFSGPGPAEGESVEFRQAEGGGTVRERVGPPIREESWVSGLASDTDFLWALPPDERSAAWTVRPEDLLRALWVGGQARAGVLEEDHGVPMVHAAFVPELPALPELWRDSVSGEVTARMGDADVAGDVRRIVLDVDLAGTVDLVPWIRRRMGEHAGRFEYVDSMNYEGQARWTLHGGGELVWDAREGHVTAARVAADVDVTSELRWHYPWDTPVVKELHGHRVEDWSGNLRFEALVGP